MMALTCNPGTWGRVGGWGWGWEVSGSRPDSSVYKVQTSLSYIRPCSVSKNKIGFLNNKAILTI